MVHKGAIAADRAFVHNDMARKLTKCRQIRQIGLLCPVIYSVEIYTGSYADSTFVPTEPCIKLSYLTVIGDLCEHKGSIAR